MLDLARGRSRVAAGTGALPMFKDRFTIFTWRYADAR